MSISVQNITKVYGQQKALDNVSFEIEPGGIMGFLGPNGAGKSTMMKIITCFLPQTSGTVSVCGHDVEHDPMAVKRSVGYLPEHNPLYLDMYVKEYLDFIAGLHKLDKRRNKVNDMIGRVGLELEQSKKIGALSKGYRQRVGLAQALIHDPPVLILDEPTSGLDPNQIVEIRELIKSVGKEKTVMMSTHIMQEVEAICDRVIIINRGNIVANETAANLKNVTGNVQVLMVEFNSAVAAADLTGIAGVAKAVQVDGNKWRLEAAQDADARDAVFRFAVDKNLSVLGLTAEEQRLEDVFKALTKQA